MTINHDNLNDLLALVARGEDSATQFKADVRNGESLAAEMAAFANADGGIILVGVADDGTVPGLSREDLSRVNQLIGNAASQLVRSPLAVQTRNVQTDAGRVVIVLTVPKGIDKPYFDKNGVIWLKCGADKRRINSKEELRRIFQFANQFHADELPTKAGLDRLDRERFGPFLQEHFRQAYPRAEADRLRLLQNLNLATDSGVLNLAGVLLFAKNPERIKPSFLVKAVAFPGSTIAASAYNDSEDFAGPLQVLFRDAMAFIGRNLRKVQAGRGVNAPGTPEIPMTVFEELLVNALVHRDYLIEAPIRLFVFVDRIEIVSPGHLPNNLTVEKIRTGNSNIRNPILASYVAKGLLPYHGIGSGIQRALQDWPDIVFTDDREGCLFISTVLRKRAAPGTVGTEHRSEKTPDSPNASEESSEKTPEKGSPKSSPMGSPKSSPKSSPMGSPGSSPKTEERILSMILRNPAVTTETMGAALGISKRAVLKQIATLKEQSRLRRIGPAKGGHWEVLS